MFLHQILVKKRNAHFHGPPCLFNTTAFTHYYSACAFFACQQLATNEGKVTGVSLEFLQLPDII